MAKNWIRYDLISSSLLKFLPFKEFCKDRNNRFKSFSKSIFNSKFFHFQFFSKKWYKKEVITEKGNVKEQCENILYNLIDFFTTILQLFNPNVRKRVIWLSIYSLNIDFLIPNSSTLFEKMIQKRSYYRKRARWKYFVW